MGDDMRMAWRYAAVIAAAVLAAAPAAAGITVYDEGDKKLEVGGRVHLQYSQIDADGERVIDDLFFRRLRPYIAGTVSKDWWAKIEFDFGVALQENEVSIKDAYVQYLGLRNHKLTIGNSKTPFARSFLTSSNKQQLVERAFVGDHNFGVPDRQLGLRLDGWNESKKITWLAAVGSEAIDPAHGRVDFDTPVNRDGDWNEGWLAAARVDFHPRGNVAFSHSDFRTDGFKYVIGVGAYTWDNDGDKNTYTDASGMTTMEGLDASRIDLDSATGIEVSAAVRGRGLSADASYQAIDADAVDVGYTGGLFVNGQTSLDKYALELGYMLGVAPVELAVAWDSLDADGYEDAWERMSFGVTWFWNQHNAKWQNTIRVGDNVGGVADLGTTTFFSQLQFVF